MKLGRSPAVLIIVARDNAALYSYLTEEFARDLDLIEIVIDRRDHGQRRCPSAVAAEYRNRERRTRVIDGLLRTLGWALVRRDTGSGLC